jgi:protein O-GlcNAc transferase
VTDPRLLLSARQLHQSGRFQEAEAAYRRLLDAEPANVDALHSLGGLLYQLGRFPEAVDAMERALRERPSDAVLLSNLGSALRDSGRWQEAEANYRRALEQAPQFADAYSNLGCLLQRTGRFAEAEKMLRTALDLNPRHAYAHNYLGMVLGDLGRMQLAIDAFQAALAIQPHFAQAHYNLGVALLAADQPAAAEQALRQALALAPNIAAVHTDLANALTAIGRLPEAEQSYLAALALQPTSSLAHLGLGVLLRQRGQVADSEKHLRRALELDPNLAQAHSSLGLVFFQTGKIEEAERSYRRALALEPRAHVIHAGFAHALMGLGRLDEAEATLREAVRLRPAFASAHSSLLFLLNHQPGRSAAAIHEEHLEFGRRFKAGAIAPFANGREADRPLRIGYVSGDLRQHSVASFIEPVLANHDRAQFEVTCYYNHAQPDATTQRLKSFSQRWRDVLSLTDERLAELIREDAIDVLIDLSGHTAGNRLLAFARKPAPVQATWLGYLNTTGLDTMDWRVTDAHACPPGNLDRLHTEALLRLPDSQWCYQPPAQAPDVAPPPILASGTCTFAAFSTAAKINHQVINLWERVLDEVPGSRLLIALSGVASVPSEFRRRCARIAAAKILPARGFDDYLALHARADVMLDTFPYTGGTTSCHALWMGVPMVSLLGDTATSRGGASLLHALDLAELLAPTPADYVAIAARLAGDPDGLRSLRLTLRERMRSSPITDAPRFTRHLENAYRSMWRRWCHD